MKDTEYTYPVTVALSMYRNDIPYWDKICIEAMELFGLPGGRYITNIGGNSMDWIFRDQQDALLFKLKFSEVTC